MRQILLVAVFIFATSPPALYQQVKNQSKPTQNAAVEQELINLEKEWNASFLRKDVATLKNIMADDMVIIYGDGSRATKTEDLANIGKDEQVRSSAQDEFQVRVFGNAAVVMSRLTSTGTREGKEFRAQFRYVDVFERRDGRWQCVVTQNTRIGKVAL